MKVFSISKVLYISGLLSRVYAELWAHELDKVYCIIV